ncbi:MAG: 50S ribosomal protein L5 [Verrucomicrobia bacterium]|nr:50S ribosomal protein L5 [Verrucomicrobiota bacterium]
MHQPELKQFYSTSVQPTLMKSHGHKNPHQAARLVKIVINTGFNASIEKGQIEDRVKELSNIAGQKAVVTKARKSISNFKLREGMPIGAMVTLRGARMYEFLQRLIAIALPGIRDFRGVNDKFDGTGNYTLGISDTSIFPEAHSDANKHFGLDICFVTSAETDAEGRELLQLLGMPFRKRGNAPAQAKA